MAKQRVGRNALEVSPWDDLTNRKKAAEEASSKGLGKPAIEKPAKEPKAPLTVVLSAKLMDKARDVVYWSHGLTLAKLVEQALAKEIERLEKAKGESFPNRKEEKLSSGRPVK
jgi:hypothetical protein